jgi:hypothetical protein
MAIEIVVGSFNPVLIQEEPFGKLIVAKDPEEGSSKLLVYGHCLTHNIKIHPAVALHFGVDEYDVLGGANIAVKKKGEVQTFDLYEFSTFFGGIPDEVMKVLRTTLENHLVGLDYLEAEKENYDTWFEFRKADRERGISNIERKRKTLLWQYKHDQEVADNQLEEMVGFFSKRRARKNGMNVRGYLQQEHPELVVAEPELPEVPEPLANDFVSQGLSAASFRIGEIDVRGVYGSSLDKWRKYLKEDLFNPLAE